MQRVEACLGSGEGKPSERIEGIVPVLRPGFDEPRLEYAHLVIAVAALVPRGRDEPQGIAALDSQALHAPERVQAFQAAGQWTTELCEPGPQQLGYHVRYNGFQVI